MKKAISLAALFLFMSALPASAREWHVTTGGSSTGSGTTSSPINLTTGMSSSNIKPGDVVLVHGGRYGAVTLKLKGSSSARITVKPYNNERVIIDNSTRTGIDIGDSYYVDIIGLEVTDSNNPRPRRLLTSSEQNRYGLRQLQSDSSSSHHLRFINMIVHDVLAQGYGWWSFNTDSEIYGNLVYYNGAGKLEHGIYTTNNSGTKRMVDNIIFDNSGFGIHVYSEVSAKRVDNFHIEGNTLFGNSSIGWDIGSSSYGTKKANMVIGSPLFTAQNPKVINNYFYQRSSNTGIMNLGYSDGTTNGVVTGNMMVGGWLIFRGTQSNLTFNNNTIYANSITGVSKTSSNTWLSSKPTSGKTVFIRRNKFDTSRSHVTVYNWANASSITLSSSDLAATGLMSGDNYEFRNVQDYFNSAEYVRGTYNGSSITLPMTGYSIATPDGLSVKPPAYFPEFAAFVLFNRSGSGTIPDPTAPPVVATPRPTLTPATPIAATPRPATPRPTIPGSTPLPTLRPTLPPTTGNTITLKPTEDTFIEEADPTDTHGSDQVLGVDGTPSKVAYLKFDVSAVTRPVLSAKLRIRTGTATGADTSEIVKFKLTNTSWSENTLTGAAMPSILKEIGTFTGASLGEWKEIDITSTITSLGTTKVISISASTPTDAGYDFFSKESVGNEPQLVLTLEGETPSADGNKDNMVDGTDYIIWLRNYGKQLLGTSSGDFNVNGTVDLMDYFLWKLSYVL